MTILSGLALVFIVAVAIAAVLVLATDSYPIDPRLLPDDEEHR